MIIVIQKLSLNLIASLTFSENWIQDKEDNN